MRATATAATTTTLVAEPPGAREHPIVEALLSFKLRHYKPRDPPAPPAPGHELAPAAPSSIKDAIIHWLDEQL